MGRISTDRGEVGKCGLPWWLSGKESACEAGDMVFNPWVRKIPG